MAPKQSIDRLNSGYTSSYALIRIHYIAMHIKILLILVQYYYFLNGLIFK